MSKTIKSKKVNKNNQNQTKIKWIVPIIGILIVAIAIALLTNNRTADSNTAEEKVDSVKITVNEDLKITKSDISGDVKFYPYQSGETYMEVLAVKATDGTIRTALNTCQVCYDSGRGYYVQQGDRVICQNCGNEFRIDNIERVKNGCNPIPILAEEKTETETEITITKDFMASNKEYFLKWKR